MAEGYIVYESFYYVSEYIKKIENTPRAVVWDDQQDEDKREGEILQTNGKRFLIKSKLFIFHQFSTKKSFTLKLIIYFSSHVICFEFLYTLMNSKIDAINKFILNNAETMRPWVALYEDKRRKRGSNKKAFK
jgi:hypothetical protein